MLKTIKECELCKAELPLPPRPILQIHPSARILIAGQAPGSKTHDKGIPFDDASGNRLRDWMGVTRQTFYDDTCVAVVPMAFCFPGTGKGGDLPPPPRCAQTWRGEIMAQLNDIKLTLVIGQYAMAWHLPEAAGQTLTETVRNWRTCRPGILPLPHPSPRNNRWLKSNPWFETEVLPELRARVASLL